MYICIVNGRVMQRCRSQRLAELYCQRVPGATWRYVAV